MKSIIDYPDLIAAKKVLVFHHDDIDGYSSAWVVNKFYVSMGVEVTLVEMEYGRLPIFKDVEKGNYDACFIVDFSFDMGVLNELETIIGKDKVVVIDHHENALNKIRNFANIIYIEKHAGCELTYKFFYPTFEIPIFLRYIGDMDIMSKRYLLSLDFTTGFRVKYSFKNLDNFTKVFNSNEEMQELIRLGSIYKDFQNRLDEENTDYFTICDYKGKNVGFINWSLRVTGLAMRMVERSDIDYVMSYTISDAHVAFSMRARNEDVRVDLVANEFGGNGHKAAAGFKLDHEKGFKFINEMYQNAIRLSYLKLPVK